MRQNGTILLPLDLSDACVPALEFARGMCRVYDARLVLLHVVDEPPVIWRFWGKRGEDESPTTEEAESVLNAWLASLGPSDVPHTTKVVVGGAGRQIVREARELPADFVVLATHGNTGFQARFMGGTAYQVLRAVRCPVASVKPPGFERFFMRMWESVQLFGDDVEAADSVRRPLAFPPRCIVHPTDFSDASHHATQLAARMAGRANADLVVLHVASGDTTDATIDESLEQIRLQVEAMGGTSPVLSVRRGDPAAEVLRESVERSADLIVMGSEGIGGLSVLSVGSTAARVVRQASCPVVTLRADTSLRAIDKEFRKVFASLSVATLRSPDEDDEASDIDELVRAPQSEHFLGFYTRTGFVLALEEYGFMQALRKRGYADLRPTFDLSDPFEHTFRVYDGAEEDREHLLIEMTLRPTAIEVPRVGEASKRVMALLVSWLCMQDPRAEFSPRKPPMPNQGHPGLGLGREMLELLLLIAERLDKSALVNRPMHLHNARYYHHKFRFLDPRMEGRLAAILRDTADVSLADASWAMHLECLLDARTKEPLRWEGREQVFPMTDELRHYFESPEYRREVWTTAAEERYEIDWERFKQRASQPPTC